MSFFVERLVYGVVSGIVAAGIAMSILFWTGGQYEFRFFILFIGSGFLLGMVVGKQFMEVLGQLFKAMW